VKLFNRFVIEYVPRVATISLWIYYILYRDFLIDAILVSIYSILLYVALESKKIQSIDGVIEVTETERGTKSFQLIVNKDPEELQDQDTVIFLFKDVS
jgi:hypothetical protein